MNRMLYHILPPAIMIVLFFIVAATPVSVLGCATRGLIALTIALISGLLALAAAIMGIRSRIRGDIDSVRWILSSLLFTIPVIGMLILA